MKTRTRNGEIQRSLEESKVPILPFELTLAKLALVNHIANQAELGVKMGEAMEQSSETWHDNAPAEAISAASKNLSSAAERTIGVIDKAEIFDYAAEVADGVTLGSLVRVRYGQSDQLSNLLLTGVSRELTSEIAQEIDGLEDVDVITLASPIGQVILGKQAGEQVTFATPNGRTIVLSIESVQQIK